MILQLDQRLFLFEELPVNKSCDGHFLRGRVAVNMRIKENHPDHGDEILEIVHEEADPARRGEDLSIPEQVFFPELFHEAGKGLIVLVVAESSRKMIVKPGGGRPVLALRGHDDGVNRAGLCEDVAV